MSYCPTNLPPIPNMTCGIRYGQVQKIAFTRIGNLFSNLSNPITDTKNGQKFVSANRYVGKGQYEQVMPCEELGNFCFFSLKDPQETIPSDRNRIKSPFSLIIWCDVRKVSLTTDERNIEQMKDQILSTLDALHNPYLTITRIYEKWQNVFSEYTYDIVANHYLMSPYAGIRIEGYIEARVSCIK